MEFKPELSLHETVNEQIFESLSSGVLACDAEGTVLRVNQAAARHLGLDPGSLLPGASLQDIPLVAPLIDILEKLRVSLQPISRMELELNEHEDIRVLGITASPLKGSNTFSGVIFLFIDMTELRRLERLATLNQQLAQIGELTAGVVHELRNPLSVISGMAELLVRKLEAESHRERAETIFVEANHMNDLITQFLGFARPFTVNPVPVPLEDIVKRTVGLCKNLAREKKVQLVVDVPKSKLKLVADLEKIAQALSNILRNAIEATATGGTVNFRVVSENGSVIFRSEDAGPGIHLAPNEDLFNAFFTKKPNGTGLGLSIAHRMVSAHSGAITFGNRPGGGAWFEVALPDNLPPSH